MDFLQNTQLKLSYITGLQPVVLQELGNHNFKIVGHGEDCVYIPYSPKNREATKQLRSVARAYIVIHGDNLHPAYLSNHKSIIGELIEEVTTTEHFATFKITCAGSDSEEVRSIASYIHETYKLEEHEEADLKLHIIKIDEMWEVGIQTTPRPLSVRSYKVANMSGAMEPTIAYAMNTLSQTPFAASYLNAFSGSGTLMIEAAQCFPNLTTITGFDNNKKHLSLSIQNIKAAELLTKIKIHEADIFDAPDFGTFDIITADLPFGMAIGKDEDLTKLYSAFISYCQEKLSTNGRVAVYTSETDVLEPILAQSRLRVIQTLELKFITNVDAYLRPKIFICERAS